MTHTTHPRRLSLSILVLLLLIVSPEVVQGDPAKNGTHDRALFDGERSSKVGLDPMAFLVLDMWLSQEGAVSLTWSDLGSNFVYTVEFSDSVTGRWDILPPVEQWPIGETSWTDTSASDSASRYYRIHTEALRDPPAAPTDVSAGVEEGDVVIRWDAVPGASSYNVYWSTDADLLPTGATKIEDVSSPFKHSGLDFGVTYYYVVTAVGNKGESEVSSVVSVTYSPPLDRTVATTMHGATEFLYTGDNPIQAGVAEGTIEPRRVAVLRGNVLTRDGEPLSGVAITVLNHPEYGQTLSRADGMFDVAANGGGYLTVDYQKDGYLPAQRQVNVPWQDYLRLPDVVLIPVDAEVTVIDFSEPMQVAQGSVVTDECGPRQATLLFSEGTQAELVMPDGSTEPVSTLSVRATEYTVGDSGPKAMPAELPPTSGYTYCVEFSADEALAAGAKDVQFDQPVINYVENFLGASVGSIVPVGYYDREKGAWIPSDNGRVIEILSINGGLAELDVDGSGQPADAQALGELRITDAERQRLAELYEPGDSLWRVSITHFSPWDCNWPYGPPEDAEEPEDPPEEEKEEDDPCPTEGSIIEAQNQVLGEVVDVIGIPFRLHYQSDRVPGRRTAYTLKIPLSGASVPESLVRIDLRIHVAGRLFTYSVGGGHPCLLWPPSLGPGLAAGSLAPPTGGPSNRNLARQGETTDLTNQTYIFTWDGKDAYGRTLQGRQPATVRVGYVYCGVYMEPAEEERSFARYSGIVITGSRTRREVTLWQEWRTKIGPWDARVQSLPGWSLDVHNIYDPVGRVLYLGNGQRRAADATLNNVITTVAGDGTYGFSGDGGPATEAQLNSPRDIAVGPDGSIYIADLDNYRIRRVGPDGVITTVAGNGAWGFAGDGGPATEASLTEPWGVALGADGSIYIADCYNYRIRRVSPDGIITTVAGGTPGYSGDGGPATEAQLYEPLAVTVGPDNSIYISDSYNYRIRRVGPDGIITTVAGNGTEGSSGDSGPATEAQLSQPVGVALGPDGSIYIADMGNDHIRRVRPDGIITTVAGDGTQGYGGDGGPAIEAQLSNPYGVAMGAGGSLYIADLGNSRIRRVRSDGIITTVTGSGARGYDGDGGPAPGAQLDFPYHAAMGPDDSLYIADFYSGRVRRVGLVLPGFSVEDVFIASEDGREIFVFNSEGRHLSTLDALTGEVIFGFTYNDAGRLTEIEDGDANITTIERDADGDPTAIVGPYGQRTELSQDANGYLSSITNPAGEEVQLTYSGDGLLKTFTDPKGATYRYTYDSLGRLAKAEDPAGGYKTLTRTELAHGYEVTVETALNRTATYRVENLSTGEKRLVNTLGCCGQNEVLIGTDGTQQIAYADGTVVRKRFGPDPRWGMQAPLPEEVTISTPGGLATTLTMNRTVTLVDPNNRLSLATLVDTMDVNGQTSTTTYDGDSRQFIETTPEGRQSVSKLDAQGRVMEIQFSPALEPVTLTYDSRARLAQMTQGEEYRKFGYDAQGRVTTLTDADGSQVRYHYNDADRITLIKVCSGRTYQFTRDGNGNVTQLATPSGPVHRFEYTATDRSASYTPPGNGSYEVTYNLDQALACVTFPSGRTRNYSYDSGGRLTRVGYAEATVELTYSVGTARIASINRVPSADGIPQNITFAYDGSLINGVTWTGSANGSYSYRYDDGFLLVGLTLDSHPETVLTRDADGLITSHGPFTFGRGGPAGSVSQISDGNLNVTLSYDHAGRMIDRTHSVNGQKVYQVQLTYDNVGRIVQKVDTVAQTSHTYHYTYDADGQLTDAIRDEAVVESYTYDPNGNRISTLSSTATYDAQDRLIQQNGLSCLFDVDGFLTQRGSDKFQYSARGELLQATVGGQTITYIYDGLGRLVGRTDSEGTYQYLYGSPHDIFQITAMRDRSGALSVYYYDAAGLLFAINRGNAWCYVATDQVGTPRVVCDAQGQAVKITDYDSFGNTISDSNPAFDLPIGFAGGLADSNTGLVRFGLRDYDPLSGRWTTRDPIFFGAGQANLYVYVRNNPVSLRDPSGLVECFVTHIPQAPIVVPGHCAPPEIIVLPPIERHLPPIFDPVSACLISPGPISYEPVPPIILPGKCSPPLVIDLPDVPHVICY